MKTKHTPGPWHVDTYCGKQAVLDEHSGVVAERVPKQADAALIAAAPELLEALREVAEQNRLLRDALDEAIEFATDKSTSVCRWSKVERGSLQSGMRARAALAKATGAQP